MEEYEKCGKEKTIECHYEIGKCFLPKGRLKALAELYKKVEWGYY